MIALSFAGILPSQTRRGFEALGVVKKIKAIEDKTLRVYGFILLGMSAIDGLSALGCFLFGEFVLGVVFSILSLGFGLISLPLLLFGNDVISRILTPYFACSALFFAASYYGPEINVQYSIFIGAIYPFVVFRASEWGKTLICIFAPLAMICFLEASGYRALDKVFGANFHLYENHEIFGLPMVIASFLIVCLALFCFSTQTLSFEEKLLDTRQRLDILVRTVCHDLKNPLTIAMARASMLEAQWGPNRHLAGIIKSHETILSIINNVTSIHRINVGKLSLKVEPVDLVLLVKQCCQSFQADLLEKNLSIDFDTSGMEALFVDAHPTFLSQSVLNNLISNAIKFSHKGSKILIKLVYRDQEVHLIIKDEGIGIPEQLLPDLFDFTIPTTREGTSREQGTGFGLPIARTYIEAMQGKLSVESSTRDHKTSGTQFTIQLKRSGVVS